MPGTERRIVVGVDGSAASQRTLDWGIAEAHRVGASLHLVTASMFPMALGYAFTTTVQEVRQSAQDVIDRATAHAAEVAGDVTVTGETTEQSPDPRWSRPPRMPTSWWSAHGPRGVKRARASGR